MSVPRRDVIYSVSAREGCYILYTVSVPWNDVKILYTVLVRLAFMKQIRLQHATIVMGGNVAVKANRKMLLDTRKKNSMNHDFG